jgi:ribosomal protein S18 acetylase RimI-like enzyme
VLLVRRILPQNVDLFKTVRLHALEDSPSAFCSTYEREVNLSDEEWRSRIDRWNGETGVGFLAIDRDVPCGIGGALIDPADRSRAQLVSMWTAPMHRRKGVGSLLVNAVIEWMRSHDASALVLMVTSTNEPAIRFYTRLGFAMTGRTEPYPNDAAITELEMIRWI